MYRVIIGERDSNDILILSRIIDRFRKKIKLIGTTSNGNQLVHMVQEFSPDILILNVKLIGINGIDVIRQVRSFDSKIHIIIFTEYDYFEFAQAVIPYRLDGYLIKPIKNEDMFNLLSTTIGSLNDKDIQREKFVQRSQEYKEHIRFIEYSFIYSLLFSGEYIDNYPKLLDLEHRGYIINIELEYQYIERWNTEKESYLLYSIIKSVIEKYTTCAIGPLIMNRIVVYICERPGFSESLHDVLAICDDIIYNMKEQLNNQVKIGVGTLVNIEQLHVSYEESIKSLRYKKDYDIDRTYISNIDDNRIIVHQSYIELERLMIDSVKMGHSDSLEHFSSLLDMLKSLQLQDRKNKIVELIILVCHAAREEGPSSSFYLNYIGYIEEIREVDDIDIEAWAYRKFQYLLKGIQMRKTVKLHPIIHNSIAYIEKNYTKDITLEKVSSMVGLTPQYFSSYFKEEMDITFTEHITKLRIEKAKELIRNSQMSIQEVCFFVGYHDPNYFSRIFKKYVGCTPSRYKKEYGNI